MSTIPPPLVTYNSQKAYAEASFLRRAVALWRTL